MKRKNSIHKIFVIVSYIFIQALILIYGYRLVHFYRLEHQKYTGSNEEPVLVDKLKLEETNKEIGLQKEDDTYYYKGNVVNNYIRHLGYLWRVIKFDENEIVLISEESVSSLSLGSKKEYKDSYIEKWLNSKFKTTLKNTEDLLIDNIKILSKEDYEKVGSDNSFINNEKYIFWLTDGSYIDEEGQIKTSASDKDIYGIRPVIKLKADIASESGIGTIDNPYATIKNTSEILYERFIGEYITWDNNTYRIIDINETGVKVLSEKSYNDTFKQTFGYNNTFNKDTKTTLAYYLNNDFYNTINKKEDIILSKWYTGSFGKNKSYNYESIKDNETEAYIGLLGIGDLFINSEEYLLTPGDNTSSSIYIGNKNASISTVYSTVSKQYRPVFYLKGDLIITSGEGTKTSPLKVGE